MEAHKRKVASRLVHWSHFRIARGWILKRSSREALHAGSTPHNDHWLMVSIQPINNFSHVDISSLTPPIRVKHPWDHLNVWMLKPLRVSGATFSYSGRSEIPTCRCGVNGGTSRKWFLLFLHGIGSCLHTSCNAAKACISPSGPESCA